MVRYFVSAGAILLACTASAQDITVNDPHAVVRQVSGFDGISVSGAIELYVVQGETKVAVSAPEKQMTDDIITEVRDRILYIRFRSEKSVWSDQWNTMGRKYRAYVAAERIRYIALAGSGNIRIEGALKSDELAIKLAGSGNISGKVDAGKLSVSLSGSGNTKLTGTCGITAFNCAGSGNIACGDLVTESCEVRIAGSGNAEVHVQKELSVSISGSGNVRYRGSGSLVNASTAGSGRVMKVSQGHGVILGHLFLLK